MHSYSRKYDKGFRTFSSLSAALALAGCSLIPTYERPAAPVPAGYALADPQAAADAPAAADIAWQDYFTDPRLQRLIGMALGNNRDLRLALLNVEQARAQFQIRRADEYPTLSGVASATRQPNPATGRYGNAFQVGVGISAWEIDFFGRIAALKEQALEQYLATTEARGAAQISLVAAVATGWLNLLADEELLDLSRRTLATREESVRLTRLRLENGVSSELDNRQAASLAEAARATYAQQQRQRLLDENALVLLLGQSLPEDIRASLPSSRLDSAAPMQPLAAGLPSELLQRRPDIRQAEHVLRGANANIGAARAAFFPRIALTASVGSVSDELSGLFKGGSWAFSLAPQLALPLFDAGRNQANLESSRVGREIAVAQYEKSIQTAFREVSDALAGRATLSEQLQAQRAQAEADAKRLELSDLRYRNGIASYLDVLDAQRSLFATQQALVGTQLQRLQNQVALYKVLGGGWNPAMTYETLAAGTVAPR
ncbi:outer membrane protein, multidrug efflux system [Oryzisolibacter propanilivorax]|uniref:Outer membrane protein, multidrug efflux system n=1 Tax=Oryzisolibacter propanilivorax TaxID=1527607 RepID=A0A1G9V8C0_9BURK|nr:efflux transporter outer membrane subunit [Oryzisolibacter propanilivorax]SDM68399.1 outer membrane protein, multidrug efflux system [Oryzisolibacter propanilivorax]